MAAEVRSHDDDGVLEVHRASLVVCQMSIVEHLQENVEHVWMRFLNFVEQNYRVWFASYRLCELSAFIVAHISRRSAYKSAHTVFLLIFAHINACHQSLVVEKIVGKGFCQFRFTHTCASEENERTDRAARILQSSTASAYSVAHRLYSLVLTDDTLVQFFFKMQELFSLALHHLAYRDSCPTAHHVGNIVGSNLFLNHGVSALGVG